MGLVFAEMRSSIQRHKNMSTSAESLGFLQQFLIQFSYCKSENLLFVTRLIGDFISHFLSPSFLLLFTSIFIFPFLNYSFNVSEGPRNTYFTGFTYYQTVSLALLSKAEFSPKTFPHGWVFEDFFTVTT